MRAEELVERVWSGSEAQVEPLGGGITNHNFKVEVGGDTFVLRIAVKLDKDFLGKEALEAARGPERRLACLVLDDPRAVALGSEPVRIGGEPIGRVTSGGYGYTVERSIAYAYVPAEHADPGNAAEVEIFGESVAGEVAAEPLYDSEGDRLRS